MVTRQELIELHQSVDQARWKSLKSWQRWVFSKKGLDIKELLKTIRKTCYYRTLYSDDDIIYLKIKRKR